MTNIDDLTFTLTLRVTVRCIEPESFDTLQEYTKNDVRGCKEQLKQDIIRQFEGLGYYATKITKIQ
jgi:hypothetical protein